MKSHSGDLVDTYRMTVKWGLYDEAAKIHRQMIGLPLGDVDPALTFELRSAEKAPQARGLFASLLNVFHRKGAAD